MDSRPPLAICLVTYERTPEALRTIIGICKNLEYPKNERAWFINDDGSPPEHVKAIRDMLSYFGEDVQWFNTERFGGETFHCGKGWNLAMGKAHQYSDFVLWMEDDWELNRKLLIEPSIALLHDHDDVGIVTFRGSGIDGVLHNVKYDGIHYHEFWGGPYIYSGNPHLRHARFTRHFGMFAERLDPGELEWEFDTRVHKLQPGPKILRPASTEEWGLFDHIGKMRTFR